jgi:hypothetical protein
MDAAVHLDANQQVGPRQVDPPFPLRVELMLAHRPR